MYFHPEKYNQTFQLWAKSNNLGEYNPISISSSVLGLVLKLFLSFNNILFAEYLLLFLIFSSGLYFSHLLFSKWFRNIYISSVLSLFFVFNLFTTCRLYDGHLYLVLTYYSLPLFIYLVDNYLSKGRKIKELLCVSIASAIYASGFGNMPMSIGTIFLPTFLLIIIKTLFVDKSERTSIYKKIILLLFVVLAANIYWIVPTMHFYQSGLASSEVAQNIDYGSSWPDLAMQKGGIVNILRMNSHWLWSSGWAGDSWYYFSGVYDNSPILIIFSLLFSIIALSAFLIEKIDVKTRFLLIFSAAVLIIHIMLANGIQNPTGNIWKILYEKVPFFMIFRAAPTKFGGPIVLALAILIGIVLTEIQKWNKKVFGITTIFLLAIIITISSPLLSGNIFYRELKGAWDHRNLPNIPQEYIEISNILSQDYLDSNVYEYPFGIFGFFDLGYKKYEGMDILSLMTDRNLISICSGLSVDCKVITEPQTKIGSKLDKLKIMNVRYVLNRMDLYDYSDKDQNWKKDFLIDNKDLSLVASNNLLNLYRISDTFFLPHFYFETKLENQYSADWKKSIEYKKVSNQRYIVNLHNVNGVEEIVFSDNYSTMWKMYGGNIPKQQQISIEGYKVFEGNPDQASQTDLARYVELGQISNTGDGRLKTREYRRWLGYSYKLERTDNYFIEFISKNFYGTIQNNNLDNGKVWSTWFDKPIVEEVAHSVVNGYANKWIVNVESVCKNEKMFCRKNSDGSYDVSLIVDFWPQRLYYIGVIISVSVIFCLSIITIFGIRRHKG